MTGDSAPAAAGLRWIVVVPVKGALGAKTRLGEAFDERRRGELALAFARDTITAALAADSVDGVIVVTNATDAVATDDARLTIVAEGEPRGLNAAIGVGVEHARSLGGAFGVAVLLGDLPALRSTELDDALASAAAYPCATVPDAEGTGTTLLTGAPGAVLVPAFGTDSAQAHREGGAVVIEVPLGSTLRRDVDTPAALDAAIALGVGPATAAVLAAASLRR